MNYNNSIGVFDSGLGGISVLNKCISLLPGEDFIYFADKRNAPYGDKSKDEIINLMVDVMENIFIPSNVKAVVIACNTATNAAIDILRTKYDMPIIGTEPAIKPAIHSCPSDKKTVVLATESTVNSYRFKNKLNELDSDRCIPLGCSGLVELIESEKNELIDEYLVLKFKEISGSDIDSIVLGCTHYPFIKDNINNVLKEDVKFFDGGEGVSRRLKYLLEINELLCRERKIGSIKLMNSLDDSYNEFLNKYIRRC